MVVPKRSAERLESQPPSAAASVKASSPVDGAAARDPDGEWAMSLPFPRSLCACGSAPAKEGVGGRAGCGFLYKGLLSPLAGPAGRNGPKATLPA